ncbi:hypothetical protein Hanom_Chr15g01403661 [Helianthus anomalus]
MGIHIMTIMYRHACPFILESEISDVDNPTTTAIDNEVASASEIFTSGTESDPDMLTKDEDDIQKSALPDFVYDHFITGHPDGEHTMAPILDNAHPVYIPSEGWLLDE